MPTTFVHSVAHGGFSRAVVPQGFEAVPNRAGATAGSAERFPSAVSPADATASPRHGDKHLIQTLTSSTFYQDYERAFSEATGLVVALRPVESWQLPHHGQRHENSFCALMAQKSRSCAACLQVQQRLATAATHETRTETCPVGLCDTAVPVRLGDRLIGFLQTGQVFLKRPTRRQFEQTAKRVAEWGLTVDRAELKRAYFSGRVLTSRQQEAVVKLLAIFAQHLAMISNQILVQQGNTEPAMITKAKEFIQTHQGDDLTLEQVARAAHVSTFYFCKLFKRTTGLNFTEYVSRVRIERAKNLLLNPNLRISEIAFEVGFQSLTHFNRVFGRILGCCPTDYRTRLSVTPASEAHPSSRR